MFVSTTCRVGVTDTDVLLGKCVGAGLEFSFYVRGLGYVRGVGLGLYHSFVM